MADDLIGKYLGRYHLLEKLGEGGMAVVYKALDTSLERYVAVKVILPHQAQSEQFLCIKEMTDVRPGMVPAGKTTARSINRPEVLLKFGISELKVSAPRKRLAIPAVTGRNYAVEHIHPGRYRLYPAG